MRRSDMTDIVDGAFDTPDGRKVFVRRRSGESAEHFAQRAMAILEGETIPPDEILEEDQ
jgi:hypothetical protein